MGSEMCIRDRLKGVLDEQAENASWFHEVTEEEKREAIGKFLGQIPDELKSTATDLAIEGGGYVSLVEAIAKLKAGEIDDFEDMDLEAVQKKAAGLVAAGSELPALSKAIADFEAGTIESYQGMDLAAVKEKAGGLLKLGVPYVSVDAALRDFRKQKIQSYQDMEFTTLQRHDLNLVSTTYMTLGFIVLGTLLVFLIKKMPKAAADDDDEDLNLGATFGRLMKNPRYVGGVIAQMFYCLLYTSPSPRDLSTSRMPSSA